MSTQQHHDQTGDDSQPIPLPPLPKPEASPLPAPPPDEVASAAAAPHPPVELPDLTPVWRAIAEAPPEAPPPAAGHGSRIAAAVPIQRAEPERPRKGLFRFWGTDASAEHDAEVMARIMAGKQERDAEAQAAIARVAVATEHDRREIARVRQRMAIEMYLAAQLRQAETETPLQRALRETADSFMALGICPDHLEYLPDIGKFCSWGGQVYDHAALHALRDRRGQQVYTLGPSPHGPATVAWSRRECGWHLNRPLDPATKLTAIDRLVPTPMRRDDGGYRFSAQRASTIIMEEGLSTIYVVGNAVYTLTHLQAAHHRHVAG